MSVPFSVVELFQHLRDMVTAGKEPGKVIGVLPDGNHGYLDPSGHAPDDSPDVIAADTMGTWWTLPAAVTFEGNIYTGGVSESGQIVVESTRPVDDRTVLGTFEQDDHNRPALLVEPDHGPLVVYARHNIEPQVRYRRGTVPGDLTTLGTEQALSVSGNAAYAQLWRTPGTDTVRMLVRRATPRAWVVFTSHDFGATWGAERMLLDGTDSGGTDLRAYMGTVRVGSTVRIAVARHPSENDGRVRYLEADLNTGEIRHPDGSVAGNLDGTGLPLQVADLHTVYEAPSGHDMRLYAVSPRPGSPAIGVGTWTDDNDGVYRHVDHDNGVWTDTEVVADGGLMGGLSSQHYAGGIAFPNPTKGDELWVSRNDAGTWRIERWRLLDGSWLLVDEIDSSASAKLVRPWPSIGGGLVYNRAGTYTQFDDYADVDTLGMLKRRLELSDELPRPDGAAAAGTSGEAARADHVHPASASKASGQRFVVLHDFGTGPEPVTDADGLWLYGAFDIELEH